MPTAADTLPFIPSSSVRAQQGYPLENMLDHSLLTWFRTNDPVKSGDWIKIDTQETSPVRSISLKFGDSTPLNPRFRPPGGIIEVSADDHKWTQVGQFYDRDIDAGVNLDGREIEAQYVRVQFERVSDSYVAVRLFDIVQLQAALTPGHQNIQPGHAVTFHYTVPRVSPGHRIAVYHNSTAPWISGEENHNYIHALDLHPRDTTGSLTFAPNSFCAPGDYLAFLLTDSFAWLTQAPATFTVTDQAPTLTAEQSIVEPGQSIRLTYSTPVANDKNWIGLYEKELAPETSGLDDLPAYEWWKYAPTTGATISIPAPEGEYIAFFFADDGYYWLTDEGIPITVTSQEPLPAPRLELAEVTAFSGPSMSLHLKGSSTSSMAGATVQTFQGNQWIPFTTVQSNGSFEDTKERPHLYLGHALVQLMKGGQASESDGMYISFKKGPEITEPEENATASSPVGMEGKGIPGAYVSLLITGPGIPDRNPLTRLTVTANGEWGPYHAELPSAGQFTLEARHENGDRGEDYASDWTRRVFRLAGPPTLITTVAGTGNTEYNGDNIPATQANLATTYGITCDGEGNLYIPEYHGYRIRRVNANSGLITTYAGTGEMGYNGDGIPASEAKIDTPLGVTVTREGRLFFAEFGVSETSRRLRYIDASSGQNQIYTYVNGAVGTTLFAPWCVHQEYTSNGTYTYFTDAHGNRLWAVEYDPDVELSPRVIPIAGTGEAGYSGDGGSPTAARLSYPWGVSATTNDSFENTVYIADTHNHRVRKIERSNMAGSVITTVAGTGESGHSGDGGPATNAKLNEPRGVWLDEPSGDLYIADYRNHRVRKIDGASGIITTVAGTGESGHSGDGGPATNAKLWYPTDIAVDDAGNLYICDSGNYRIRKVTQVRKNL
ncbi:discoidin domain-containing protein [Streptomyces sp. NPDC090442]|uniref:NHL domain-containing protein n=1 Tax=Streptomyces sp. NPDC090442 TaxID=3365962 RepID=UPI0037F8BFC8